MGTFKKNLIHGTLWSSGGQFASLLLLFGTNIWLARILDPAEYGLVGVFMFFITVATVLTEGGLSGALIRKKQATKDDYSTVFIFNLTVSVLCFILLVISSSYIALYYKNEQLQDLLIVSSLVLIINAFRITQNAKMISELKFKQIYVLRFISVVVGSVVGITLAYCGFGVWSLVWMQLSTSIVLTVLYWVREGTFFSFNFDMTSFKKLYAFGVNTTLASLINTAFDNVYQLILARYFSVSQVGYYYQAKKLQDVPGGIINTITQGVVFSSLAKLQDDKEKFHKIYSRITLTFLVLLGGISSFIYIYSEQIILFLYGEKWLGSVFYMKLLIIASFFYFQEQTNRIIFKVFNKTRQVLYLEILKKMIQAISIFIGVYLLNIYMLIVGFVITSIIGYFISYYYSRKIINIKTRNSELLIIIKTSILCCLVAFLISSVNMYIDDAYLRLLTIPLFLALYLLGLGLFKIINVWYYLNNIGTVKDLLK